VDRPVHEQHRLLDADGCGAVVDDTAHQLRAPAVCNLSCRQHSGTAAGDSRRHSHYLVAFQGANGIGALAFGGLAQSSSVSTALEVVGVFLVGATVVTWRLALPAGTPADDPPEDPLPLPDAPSEIGRGPVTISVEFSWAPGQADAFLALVPDLRRTRRRTGASRWRLARDLAHRDLFEETFVVGSWEEHEHQHARLLGPERNVLTRIDAMPAPVERRIATHALGVRVPHRTRFVQPTAPQTVMPDHEQT